MQMRVYIYTRVENVSSILLGYIMYYHLALSLKTVVTLAEVGLAGVVGIIKKKPFK